MSAQLVALRAPSANRVYTSQAGELTCAEAHWVLGAHGFTEGITLDSMMITGMPALRVGIEQDDAASATVRSIAELLGALSTTYGVAVLENSEEAPLLRPLDVLRSDAHPSDLETTLKYVGKTNEQFTALMMNLALSLLHVPPGRDADTDAADGSARAPILGGAAATITVLDPVCGRGTTVNHALQRGLSPIGAEIDRAHVKAYRAFLTTWLRTHRYKHSVTETKLSSHGQALGTVVNAELAADKETRKRGLTQHVTVYGCDALQLPNVLRRGSIDAIVADLPYGVQHGARSSGQRSRSPLDFLAHAAPGWRTMMRSSGSLVLAINRFTTDHAAATESLEDAGFSVLSADRAFQHRVDQAIDRDLIVAVPREHPLNEQLRAIGISAAQSTAHFDHLT